MTWARIFNGLVAHSMLETVVKPMLLDFSKMLGKQNGAGWQGVTSCAVPGVGSAAIWLCHS